jgi:ribonuclease HI
VVRLPPSLERRLALLFPAPADRDRFIAEAVERAVEDLQPASASAAAPSPEAPPSIGGTLHLFTDGGSRGNPGQSAIACVLEDPLRGTVLKEYAARIGIETNNVAEYRALIEGLKLAEQYHPNRLICHLDSELVVRQLNGQYQVKVQSLKAFVDEIKVLTHRFADVVFVHIPREDNHRADALVNRALDELKQAAVPSRPNSRPSLFR